MEICHIVSRPCFSPSVSSSYYSKQPVGPGVMQRGRQEFVSSNGFSDRGHLKYYGSIPVGELKGEKKSKVKNKKKKEHVKLVKGLSRDLTRFSQIGFGLDSKTVFINQDKENGISEAAGVLLEHIQKLKAEEKKLKRIRKEEKVQLKAIKKKNRLMRSDSSSSSSSSESSSDSERGEVINMNRLKRAQKNITAHPTASTASETIQAPVLARHEKCSQAGTSCTSLCDKSGNSFDAKIEVCMGGKCKKSGAAKLLDKFRGIVGIQGAVSGCKCMGKCRDGPNVKVLKGTDGDKSVRALSNTLCVGVGLEDVDTIVANFLISDNQNGL